MTIPQCIILEFPDTQVIIAYTKLAEYFWKFQLTLNCGNFVNMPFSGETDQPRSNPNPYCSMVCQSIIDTQDDITNPHNTLV